MMLFVGVHLENGKGVFTQILGNSIFHWALFNQLKSLLLPVTPLMFGCAWDLVQWNVCLFVIHNFGIKHFSVFLKFTDNAIRVLSFLRVFLTQLSTVLYKILSSGSFIIKWIWSASPFLSRCLCMGVSDIKGENQVKIIYLVQMQLSKMPKDLPLNLETSVYLCMIRKSLWKAWVWCSY